MQACLSFTCCIFWTLCSLSKCWQLKPFLQVFTVFYPRSQPLLKILLAPFRPGSSSNIFFCSPFFYRPTHSFCAIFSHPPLSIVSSFHSYPFPPSPPCFLVSPSTFPSSPSSFPSPISLDSQLRWAQSKLSELVVCLLLQPVLLFDHLHQVSTDKRFQHGSFCATHFDTV